MNNWIKVAHKLPKEHQDVLTVDENEFICIAHVYFHYDLSKWIWRNSIGLLVEPTHWMKLPELPNEEKA